MKRKLEYDDDEREKKVTEVGVKKVTAHVGAEDCRHKEFFGNFKGSKTEILSRLIEG